VEDGFRYHAVLRALHFRADVDEDRAIADRVDGVVDGDPIEPFSRASQQLLDRQP
jgi:hypothetical protein